MTANRMSVLDVANSLLANANGFSSIRSSSASTDSQNSSPRPGGVGSRTRVPLGRFPRAPGQGRELSLRSFLRESIFHNRASFFEAKTGQITATVSGDTFVKFGGEFVGGDFIAGGSQALQELEREIGAIGLRQRQG